MWDFLQNLFTALLPIVTAFAGWAGARIRNTNQKDKAVERGVKMLLRAKIIDLRYGNAERLLQGIRGAGRRRPFCGRYRPALRNA